MAGNRGRTGPAWDAARARCFELAARRDLLGRVICAWCDQPIDMTLPGTAKWGPTADHIIALEDHAPLLDQANLAPMHRTCNVSKENQRRQSIGRQLNTSRAW